MNPAPLKDYFRFIGVRYADHGRSPETGWDCYGLYAYVSRAMLGIEVPSYAAEYASAEDKGSVARAVRGRWGEWQRVPQGHEREGDGVVFNIGGLPIHCGYIITRGTMLHALHGRETVIEPYTTPIWNKRIEGFYRWNS